MFRTIVSYGTLAGLIVGIPTFAISIALNGHPPSPWGAVFGYLTMLVALSTVFVAIKRHRDEDLGGVIRFWPALGLGLAISFVASLFYVAAWEAVLAFTHMDFAGAYADMLIERQKARGVSGAALATFVADMERFKAQYADPFYRCPMTFTEIFPVGLLVSLICAALLRNTRFLPARRA
jgi:thiamine transporter ThiT